MNYFFFHGIPVCGIKYFNPKSNTGNPDSEDYCNRNFLLPAPVGSFTGTAPELCCRRIRQFKQVVEVPEKIFEAERESAFADRFAGCAVLLQKPVHYRRNNLITLVVSRQQQCYLTLLPYCCPLQIRRRQG
jgi:hypothetical protein